MAIYIIWQTIKQLLNKILSQFLPYADLAFPYDESKSNTATRFLGAHIVLTSKVLDISPVYNTLDVKPTNWQSWRSKALRQAGKFRKLPTYTQAYGTCSFRQEEGHTHFGQIFTESHTAARKCQALKTRSFRGGGPT